MNDFYQNYGINKSLIELIKEFYDIVCYHNLYKSNFDVN